MSYFFNGKKHEGPVPMSFFEMPPEPPAPPRVWNVASRDFPRDAVYIGRGSKYGNPYIIGRHGNRIEVCDLFERYHLPSLDVSDLRGCDLLCHCAPARCHGDAILIKANKAEG